MGTPPGQLPVPVLTHCGGCWGHFLWSRSPRATHQGCTSGAQLLSSPTSPGPRHLGLWTPIPAGPLLASRRHPPSSQGTGWARGCRGSRWCHSHGCWPWPLGTVAALPGWGWGGVWRGHFPAQTDGAGLEPWLPQGGGWIWYRVSAQQRRDVTNILGWVGGDPVRHRGVSLVMCHSPALSDPEPSVSYSEGVFKCPEDQLPLDYAKVSLAHGWVPCSKRTSPPRSHPQALHSAWHSHAGLARAPGRKQEPFVPRAGERKLAPDKGRLLVCPGGIRPRAACPRLPARLCWGLCAPRARCRMLIPHCCPSRSTPTPSWRRRC